MKAVVHQQLYTHITKEIFRSIFLREPLSSFLCSGVFHRGFIAAHTKNEAKHQQLLQPTSQPVIQSTLVLLGTKRMSDTML